MSDTNFLNSNMNTSKGNVTKHVNLLSILRKLRDYVDFIRT